jgi:hypothetical protein
MKRIIFLMLVLALFLISAFDVSAQTEVVIYLQSDSPLQISNVVTKTRKSMDDAGKEWNMLAVDFLVQNVGDKPIRAYTIREFSREFDSDLGGTISSFRLPAVATLKSNQSADEHLGETGSTVVSENFYLAVDFFEFADGSTWGKDLSNSAQQFAGIKTAIKTILGSLKEANQQGGIEAVIKTLNEMKELLPPDEQSEKWKRGFRIGANSIKSRLKRIYETEGKKGAEIELQKSFDAYFDK